MYDHVLSLLIHNRLVHAFTCAGVLQTQYIKMCQFAGLGSAKNAYIRRGMTVACCTLLITSYACFIVYNKCGYIDVVSRAAEDTMNAAVVEINSLPHYNESGEVRYHSLLYFQHLYAYNRQWGITDARHDSTANAYHTTVPCLSGRYKF